MPQSYVRKIALPALGLLLTAIAAPLAAQESTPSTGVFKTGQQVYDLCVSGDVNAQNQCDQFLMSAHDMIKFYGDTKIANVQICPPKAMKALELRNVALAYWRGKTGGLRFSAVSSIYNALVEKYPC